MSMGRVMMQVLSTVRCRQERTPVRTELISISYSTSILAGVATRSVRHVSRFLSQNNVFKCAYSVPQEKSAVNFLIHYICSRRPVVGLRTSEIAALMKRLV